MSQPAPGDEASRERVPGAVASWLHGDHAVTARMHDLAPPGRDIGLVLVRHGSDDARDQ
jgi:hypothetical protein